MPFLLYPRYYSLEEDAMQELRYIDKSTSGQVDPKSNHEGFVAHIIIDGCAVTLTSGKTIGESMDTVKEILLSAYRSRIANP